MTAAMKRRAGAIKPGPVPPSSGRQLEFLKANSNRTDRSDLAGSRFAKRYFDLAAALAIILIVAPFLITVMTLMLFMQGAPLFIAHRRVGRDGKPFSCLKLRTMVTDCDEVLRRHLGADPEARTEWESTRKLKVDPRVTPLGYMLRKSSVDELPQLFNVVRGEMSLVGPRPIVQDEVTLYGGHIESYYKVRPGMTGAWQVGRRNDAPYEHRVQLDVDYVQHLSFWSDLVILARTVPAVITSRGCY